MPDLPHTTIPRLHPVLQGRGQSEGKLAPATHNGKAVEREQENDDPGQERPGDVRANVPVQVEGSWGLSPQQRDNQTPLSLENSWQCILTPLLTPPR